MSFQELLDFQLLELKGIPVTVGTLLTAFLIMTFSFWASWAMRRALRRVFAARGMTQVSSLEVIARLLHYGTVLIGFTIALDTLGFSLGGLFAAGAVFAVAIGFAMQHIAENFVSGVILLVERSIRPGDIIFVEGTTVTVEEMGIRTAIVRTREDDRLIVPNSVLVQGLVKNYTLRDTQYRIRAKVGVVYGSDMNQVIDVLTRTAADLEWRSPTRDPRVQMVEFGDSAVNFDVSVWVDDPWEAPPRLSELHQAIWWALRDADIIIAFPQLDVHLDREVTTALVAAS